MFKKGKVMKKLMIVVGLLVGAASVQAKSFMEKMKDTFKKGEVIEAQPEYLGVVVIQNKTTSPIWALGFYSAKQPGLEQKDLAKNWKEYHKAFPIVESDDIKPGTTGTFSYPLGVKFDLLQFLSDDDKVLPVGATQDDVFGAKNIDQENQVFITITENKDRQLVVTRDDKTAQDNNKAFRDEQRAKEKEVLKNFNKK